MRAEILSCAIKRDHDGFVARDAYIKPTAASEASSPNRQTSYSPVAYSSQIVPLAPSAYRRAVGLYIYIYNQVYRKTDRHAVLENEFAILRWVYEHYKGEHKACVVYITTYSTMKNNIFTKVYI